MGMYFRAVREEWGEASSLFIDHENLITLLGHVADAAGTTSAATEYGDLTSVWIENGRTFLDYVEHNLTTEETVSYVPDADPLNLAHLTENLKQMASPWTLSIDSSGQLHFYVD